jgi:hypothetical protein
MEGDACNADDDNDGLFDSDGVDGMLDGAEVAVGRRLLVSEPAVVGILNFILTEP